MWCADNRLSRILCGFNVFFIMDNNNVCCYCSSVDKSTSSCFFFSAFNVNVVIGLCVAKVIVRLYQYSPVCVTHSSPKNTSQENLTVQITHYDQITYIKSWNTFFSGIECFWKYFHNKQFPVKRFYFSITLIYQTKSETSHLINCQTVCDVKSVIMTLHRRATAL